MAHEMLVVWDTETTAFNGHCVELAARIHLPSGKYHEWYEKMKPSSPIQAGAEAVHGISNDMVANCRPDTVVVKEWWDDVQALQAEEGADLIFAGHNLAFDIRIIQQYEGVDILRVPWICTVKLGRRYSPYAPNHKLQPLHDYLGLDSSQYKAHGAMDDCHMCYNILSVYQKRTGATYRQLADARKIPVILETVPFGKWKDTPFRLVPVAYLDWIIGQGDIDEDVRHTALHEKAQRRRAGSMQ